MKRGITRWIHAPGDALEAVIEKRILMPAEKHAPRIVGALRKCGGCRNSKRALNREADADPQV